MIFFALVVLAGFAIYVMTPGERTRLFGAGVAALNRAKDTAIEQQTAPEPFFDALSARTPWPIVTPALAVVNVLIFAGMIFGHGALSNPETLIGWGASIAPRTTNGEWWRLLTAMFVHAGLLHLLANLAGLAQLGLVLERLVGYFAFATVFFAAGIFANLASLSAAPMIVTSGASGAVFGLYGLLLASAIWSIFQRSEMTMTLAAAKRLAPGTAIFMLYNLATDGFSHGVALNGLVMGFVCGLPLSYRVSERKPPGMWVGGAIAATALVAVVSAVPLRGFTDVKPEIERILAFEDRIATVYQAEVKRFTTGVSTAEALAQLIDRSIIPELQSLRARLKSLARVPSEHQPLVTNAEEYLRLRDESWRLRAQGLQTHSLPLLQRADRTERASLNVLERIKPPDSN